MSSPRVQVAARLTRQIAHAIRAVYPRQFRRTVCAEHEFEDVAGFWFTRELDRSGSAARALGRTAWVMAMDALTTAPAMWLQAIGGEDRQSVPRRFVSWFSSGLRDLKSSARMLWKQPGLAMLVIGTLGLGIGASAAGLTALDRAVLRPLAFPEGDRLAFVSLQDVEQGWRFVPAMPVIERWRSAVRSFDQIEGYQPSTATYLGGAEPEVIPAANVTGGLTTLLRLQPVIGRVLGPSDATGGASPSIMVSETFWRQRLGGTHDVLTQTLRFGTTTYKVVGIWPQRARVNPSEQASIFFVRDDKDVFRASSWAFVVGRLAPHATHATADADLLAQSKGLPDVGEGVRPSVASPSVFLGTAFVRGLWLVFGAATLLMLVAIANAANLLLARASARHREIGIRLALGGSTGKLVRLFLAEGAVLSVSGALLAVGVAWATGRLLESFVDGNIPAGNFAGLDATVYAMAGAGAAFATLVCGLVPLFQARGSDIRRLTGAEAGLRITGTTSHVRHSLIALQAAIGVVLVAGAVLLARSLSNLVRSDPGFALHELVTFSLAPPSARYPTIESKNAFLTRVHDEIRGIPSVAGVTTSPMPLFRQSIQDGQPYLDGEAPPTSLVDRTVGGGATEAYFQVLGVPLRQGRYFGAGDNNVVIVNESFARSRGGNVLGRKLYQPRRGIAHNKLVPSEIVGVVGDVRSGSVSADRPSEAQVYRPMKDEYDGFARFMLRTTSPDFVLGEARRRVAALDPQLPLLSPNTGTAVFRDETAQHRFVAALLAILAALGVALAVAGVYGSVLLEVRRRFREVGLRVALGASSSSVVSLIVRQGMRPVIVGGIIGVAAWFWASSLLEALLYRIDAHDVMSTLAGLLVLAAIACMACLWPARRASRIDPAITLREN
jgi:putative ABC transport system permease protein